MKETVKESVLFFVLGVSLLVFSLVNHYSVQIEWGLSPYLFPAVIAVFMIILSVTLFAGGIRAGEKPAHEEMSGTGSTSEKNKTQWRAVACYLGAVLAYYIVMPFIGFIAADILLLAGLFILLGERVWWKIAVLSVAVTMFIYWLFHSFLHVMLP